jgi:hypothetical protein
MAYIRLGLAKIAADLVESGEELSTVDLLVAVEGVESSEDASKSTDRLGSSRVKLSAQFVQN